MKIYPGTTLIIETGDYSDYTFHGPFVVVKEIDKDEIEKEFLAQWTPKKSWEEHPSPDHFLGWLASNLYIISMPQVFTWHIGGYGQVELDEIETKNS